MPVRAASSIAKRPRLRPAPRRRLTRGLREQQLLDVALELFIEHGYQGTSMEDIASAAGITRPIVYNHFKSKDGIYLACLARARSELDRHFAAAQVHRTLEDRVRAGIEAYFGFVEENRAAWRLLFGGGVAVAGSAADEVRRMRFRTVQQIAALFSGAVTGVDARVLEAFAHGASGAGEQFAKWWISNPKLKKADIVELMLRFTWGGLQQLRRAR